MTFEEAVGEVLTSPLEKAPTVAIAAQLAQGQTAKMFENAVKIAKTRDSDGQFVAELLYITAIAVRAKVLETPSSS